VEALKDEAGDPHKRCRPNPRATMRIDLLDSGATIASIPLLCRVSEAISRTAEWLGYRSKQEFKTPTIGVSPCMRGPDTRGEILNSKFQIPKGIYRR
jgi:hypothetical protein